MWDVRVCWLIACCVCVGGGACHACTLHSLCVRVWCAYACVLLTHVVCTYAAKLCTHPPFPARMSSCAYMLSVPAYVCPPPPRQVRGAAMVRRGSLPLVHFMAHWLLQPARGDTLTLVQAEDANTSPLKVRRGALHGVLQAECIHGPVCAEYVHGTRCSHTTPVLLTRTDMTCVAPSTTSQPGGGSRPRRRGRWRVSRGAGQAGGTGPTGVGVPAPACSCSAAAVSSGVQKEP